MHELDVPRIGYVHSWSNTQNEGWVRAALDTYGVPYTYFGDIKLREGNLRQKYDVIVYPHVGGSAQAQVNGIPKTGSMPLPYKKTDRDAEPRDHRSGRRHPRRHGLGRVDGAGEVRPRGRHAHHRRCDGDDLPRVQRHERRHGRNARTACSSAARSCAACSPIGAARSRMATTRSCRCTSARRRCSTPAAAPAASAAAAAAATRCRASA